MNIIEATEAGYHEYFGPCSKEEDWMIQNAINDINLVGQHEYVIVTFSGGDRMIMVRPRLPNILEFAR